MLTGKRSKRKIAHAQVQGMKGSYFLTVTVQNLPGHPDTFAVFADGLEADALYLPCQQITSFGHELQVNVRRTVEEQRNAQTVQGILYQQSELCTAGRHCKINIEATVCIRSKSIAVQYFCAVQ